MNLIAMQRISLLLLPFCHVIQTIRKYIEHDIIIFGIWRFRGRSHYTVYNAYIIQKTIQIVPVFSRTKLKEGEALGGILFPKTVSQNQNFSAF